MKLGQTKAVKLEMPNGLSIWVTRVPVGEDGMQLAVFINTEGMNGVEHDENGSPSMQVVLNDATLYDYEAGDR
jgi:hypothetical protein